MNTDYGTTTEFLLQFGLKSLDDLPSLEEFEELLKADIGVAEVVEVADPPEPAETRPVDAGASAAESVTNAAGADSVSNPLPPGPGADGGGEA